MSKKPAPIDTPAHALVKLFRDVAHRHHILEVFKDFTEMAAIFVNNIFERNMQQVKRERRYMQVMAKYQKPDRDRVGEFLHHIVRAIDRADGAADVFSDLILKLEVPGNKHLGQISTPFHLAYMMAKMTLSNVKELVEEKGHFTIMEPCCGTGVFLLAAAKACEEAGVDPRAHMHAVGVDVDPFATHMAFLQLAVRGQPGIVCRQDVLREPTNWSEIWYTPGHILGGWEHRLVGLPPPAPPRLLGDATIEGAIVEMTKLLEQVEDAKPA